MISFVDSRTLNLCSTATIRLIVARLSHCLALSGAKCVKAVPTNGRQSRRLVAQLVRSLRCPDTTEIATTTIPAPPPAGRDSIFPSPWARFTNPLRKPNPTPRGSSIDRAIGDPSEAGRRRHCPQPFPKISTCVDLCARGSSRYPNDSRTYILSGHRREQTSDHLEAFASCRINVVDGFA